MSRKKGVFRRLRSSLRWFSPGVGIKRWVSLAILGIFITLLGATRYLYIVNHFTYKEWALIILGLAILIVSVLKIIYSITTALMPNNSEDGKIFNMLYAKHHLAKGPKIVLIGGGSGQSVLLRGFKEYTSNLSAIVTVADSGGSSGRLRDTFDILPPGDIRNCLVALADAEPLVRDLFQYRFEEGSNELAGHSFGNLFITALTRVTGDFERAVKASSQVLAVRGNVIPSCLEKVTLCAKFADGQIIRGEAEIPKYGKKIDSVFLEPDVKKATEDAVIAIKEADLIMFGPGSLYTSIIPNLLVKEIRDAIVSTDVPKVFVSNIMTQKGETDGYTVYDHLEAVIRHAGVNILTHCIIDNSIIPKEYIQRYRGEAAERVEIGDIDAIEELGISVIIDKVADFQTLIRHNPHKIYNLVLTLV